MEPLNVSGADRKIWLVKVPTSVAQVWRPLCEQSMRQEAIDEDDQAVELGAIRFLTSQGAPGAPPKQELAMTLKGAETRGLPAQYRMNQIPYDGNTMVAAVSYKAPEQEGDEWTQMRVDGTVDVSYNLMPILKVGQNGQVQIDEAYRKLSKDRLIKASVKTRVVKQWDDTRDERVAALANTKVVLDQKRRAEDKRLNKLDNKRMRKDKDKLQDELFVLFSRTPHWAFPQLQRETNQPAQYLKEMLAEIAIQNKVGPNRDLYSLKPLYREGGGKEAT